MKIQKKELLIKKLGNNLNRKLAVSEHTLVIDEIKHIYRLRISKRAKNIQIQIRQDGTAHFILPYKFRNFDYKTFIHTKSDWLKKHLSRKHSDEFLFFGEEISIISNYDLFVKTAEYSLVNKTLIVKLPVNDQRTLKQIYENWLYINAADYLHERLFELAGIHQFKPQRITVRRQKTRWGSCSQSGCISLNFKLVTLRKELIDYIIIHELCHLKELNHSYKFWKLVEEILPGYQEFRKELKQIKIYN